MDTGRPVRRLLQWPSGEMTMTQMRLAAMDSLELGD